jgi:hypothetical protein
MPSSVMHSFVDSPRHEESMAPWSDVLQSIFDRHELRPYKPAAKGNQFAAGGGRREDHIPLLQRPRADSYETRKTNLKGIKKVLLLGTSHIVVCIIVLTHIFIVCASTVWMCVIEFSNVNEVA